MTGDDAAAPNGVRHAPPAVGGTAGHIEAVLCDLDDTLFPQQQWLDGAWQAVAAAGTAFDVDPEQFLAELQAVASEGSARGGIIDRALAAIGSDAPVRPFVEAFLAHRPAHLGTYPGVRESLTRLRSAGLPLALVTDGDVGVQAGKLAALGLSDLFAVVIISDVLGREFRKPHPAPFEAALDALGVAPECAVFIGDRPDKDVGGATAVGMRAIRVRTGEYTTIPDPAETWFSAPTFATAVSQLLSVGCELRE